MRLLDLFCGAGGVACGYVRAGFEVHGVDHKPQPRYLMSGASSFVQADALDYLRRHGHEYDVIHASPPCQKYSIAKNIGSGKDHPDLVSETRRLLAATGRHYVIENVVGAPLLSPALVCGLALGLNVKRHRLFESDIFLFGTSCPVGHRGNFVSEFGHGSTQRRRWVTVYGGGAPAKPDVRRRADAKAAKDAMGIGWMTRNELSQAIPPPYAEFVGRQLMNAIGGPCP